MQHPVSIVADAALFCDYNDSGTTIRGYLPVMVHDPADVSYEELYLRYNPTIVLNCDVSVMKK